jgi:type IV pilus assembly protein PilQ
MTKLRSILSVICLATAAGVYAQTAAPTRPEVAETPAPIEPPGQAPSPLAPAPIPPVTSAPAEVAPAAPAVPAAPATTEVTTTTVSRSLNEFQGDDVSQVLRLLARQAKINLVISDKVDQAQPPLKVTMRLENKTPIEAIKIISTSKGLITDVVDDVYYVKTKEEKEGEPTESAFYTFSYATAEKILPLLTAQLQSKAVPQFDGRTNTVFYREVGSNLKNIELFLATIDKPTQQVMIEARLVEVTANPRQAYGINWGGVLGNSTNAQTLKYGGSLVTQTTTTTGVSTTTGGTGVIPNTSTTGGSTSTSTNALGLGDFFRRGEGPNVFGAIANQFAILSAPQMSLTLRLLNEDADAEFLANPRVVTASNQKATIKITRNQPVPQLNFNEQTATAVFGGFEDKEFGNTLNVTPSINKDDFVTLLVQPEISNKVGDSVFTFAGATVTSPIIDKRNLESNVLIKTGDTLAIGGLLQDETTKGRNKVPVLGDIPVLGYLFQERVNTRTKRNLLVFVTPTIIKQGYGTGLEDQVNGIQHSGEEYADPNGWRNNAKGAVRIVPTSNRQNAADYPKPGTAEPPLKSAMVRYKVSAANREK